MDHPQPLYPIVTLLIGLATASGRRVSTVTAETFSYRVTTGQEEICP